MSPFIYLYDRHYRNVMMADHRHKDGRRMFRSTITFTSSAEWHRSVVYTYKRLRRLGLSVGDARHSITMILGVPYERGDRQIAEAPAASAAGVGLSAEPTPATTPGDAA